MFEPTTGRIQLDIISLLVNIYMQTGMLGTREYTLCSAFRANAHNSSSPWFCAEGDDDYLWANRSAGVANYFSFEVSWEQYNK